MTSAECCKFANKLLCRKNSSSQCLSCFSWQQEGVVASHGACHGRRNTASGFRKRGAPIALSDTCPSQTRNCSSGCGCGHYRRQLWTGERSAPLIFILTLACMCCRRALVLQHAFSVLQSVHGSSTLQVHALCCVDEMHPVCSRWSRSSQQVQQTHTARCGHYNSNTWIINPVFSIHSFM